MYTSKSNNLCNWLHYLDSIHIKTIDLSLDRVKKVASYLNLKLNGFKFVVGGTNGKGSVCTILEAILIAAGYKVGLYTSPHLINFNERARINKKCIDNVTLINQFKKIEKIRGSVTLTYFEFTTLAILDFFSHEELDVFILEIGLGGRLDAVNIIDADCSIITNIDIDHTDFLGKTREEIALEKANIYRSGQPAICSDYDPPISLLKYVSSIKSDFWLIGRDFDYSYNQFDWTYHGRYLKYTLEYPSLNGRQQLLNTSTTLAALESVHDLLPVSQRAINIGLLEANLFGRFQILPGKPVIVLDVAHNPAAATVLANNLANMGYYPNTYAIFGMLNDKDVTGVVQNFWNSIDYWYCASLPKPRGLSSEILVERMKRSLSKDKKIEICNKIQTCDNVFNAFNLASRHANYNDRIVVFGSFLTVTPVLQEFYCNKF